MPSRLLIDPEDSRNLSLAAFSLAALSEILTVAAGSTGNTGASTVETDLPNIEELTLGLSDISRE